MLRRPTQGDGPDEKPSRWQNTPHVDPLGTRVVFIDLCRASEPLTTVGLQVRTTLPISIINAALEVLVAVELIEVLVPPVELHPMQYVACSSGSDEARKHWDSFSR